MARHYWAEVHSTEFGYGVTVKYGDSAWITSHDMDLNGAYGLKRHRTEAQRIADRINDQLRKAPQPPDIGDAIAQASQGDILRAWWRIGQDRQISYDANLGPWPYRRSA